MLGNVFNQLYTVAAGAIVGHFGGAGAFSNADALGAIGSADWLCWLVFGVITGFMQGFSILLAQRFGAGDGKGLKRAAAMTILLGGAIALVFTIGGLSLIRPLLILLRTRERVLPMAQAYLLILYMGIPLSVLSNMLTSFLRALGNSRAPLIAMASAAIANIGLDLLFVIAFHWGIRGAAASTLFAQSLAVAICLFHIRRLEPLKLAREDFKINFGDIRTLIRLASPMAFQNALISVGGMAVQMVINSLGMAYVTGFTATNKLYGLLEVAAMSFGFAITTYAGQNLGARNFERIRAGVRKGLLISLATSLCVSALIFLFGGHMLRLFIESSADPAVMAVAKRYLFTMAAALPILYFLYVYRSALQGMGDTVMPMVSGLGECAMRVGVAWVLTSAIGAVGIYYAEPAAWIGATAILMISYSVFERKLERRYPAPETA